MNLGVVGLGTVSKYYLSAIKSHKNINLTAVCDTDVKKLKPFKATGIKTYGNIEKLLADNRVDSVIICLPNALHHQAIKKALDHNKHVLCEKPLTLTLSDAKELSNLSKDNHLALKTAFHRRYNQNIKDLIDNPVQYGKLRGVHFTYLENIREHGSSAESWYLGPDITGGGCIIDNGSNVIDILLHLCRGVIIESAVIGYEYSGAPKSYDSNAYITFGFLGGRGTIELDWRYEGERKEVVLYTDRGLRIHRNLLQKFQEFKSSLWHEYEALLAEFYQQVISETFPHGEDGIQVLNVLNEILNKSGVKSNNRLSGEKR